MEPMIQNVLEKSDALMLCMNCKRWDAVTKDKLEFSNCRACVSPNTIQAPHWKWASWYNAARGYVNIPFKQSIRISHDTPAYHVLNALRQKYA